MSWRSTIAALQKRFADDANVLSISHGLKVVGGEITDVHAMVFFVAAKRPRSFEPIPKYVFDVRADGSIDRSRRYPTDVREITRAEARSSGRGIERLLAVGAGPIEHGTATLAFDSKPQSGPMRRILLSCSHVVADIWGQRRLDDYELRGRGDAGRSYTAIPIVRTQVRHFGREARLAFDAGLAFVNSGSGAVPVWSIPRLGRPLQGLYQPPLQLGQTLSFLGAATGRVLTGIVATLSLSAPLEYRLGGQLRRVTVSNLYELAGAVPVDGDSGGIVFARESAVGMVVGSFFDAKHQQCATVFHRISSVASHLRNLRHGADADAISSGP